MSDRIEIFEVSINQRITYIYCPLCRVRAIKKRENSLSHREKRRDIDEWLFGVFCKAKLHNFLFCGRWHEHSSERSALQIHFSLHLYQILIEHHTIYFPFSWHLMFRAYSSFFYFSSNSQFIPHDHRGNSSRKTNISFPLYICGKISVYISLENLRLQSIDIEIGQKEVEGLMEAPEANWNYVSAH